MGLINLIKTIFLLLVLWMFGYFFARSEMYPFEEKKGWIIAREDATFLQLNESVIWELKDKEEYKLIQKLDEDELWKEQIFEEMNKKDYNF